MLVVSREVRVAVVIQLVVVFQWVALEVYLPALRQWVCYQMAAVSLGVMGDGAAVLEELVEGQATGAPPMEADRRRHPCGVAARCRVALLG